jgi:HK97 family phage prohead protease
MIVTKAVGLVETTETEDPNGAFDVILSAATLDRDGEVIDSRAFDPLPDHVPFDIDHGMTVQTTVGSGQPYYDDAGSLRVKGTFASTPLAQEVRTLVSEGHIRTTSVTFMSADREPDEKGVMHVKTAELLNGTFTPVPSNRQAVVLSAKAVQAVTDEKVGARNSAGDASTIQSMHDSAVALGATCSAEKHAHEVDEKSTDEPKPEEAEAPTTSDSDESADEVAEPAADEAAGSATESADEGSESASDGAPEDAIKSALRNVDHFRFDA